ncbi:hypothetical protein DMC47_11060 [Nostoc sp. 3335mG]|nr:hypothetical protein DMC47_11060 [Nostoc sp. 3335mG]
MLSAAPALAEGSSACGIVDVAPAGSLLSVPFRVVDGRIYVDVRVNGQGPFPFAVDTGASGPGRADASLVARLKLAVSGSSQTSDGLSSARVDTVRLASIDLGGFVRRDLEVITRDYASRMAPEAAFAGIIGRDFFADGLLVIDYPRRRLSYTRAHGLESRAADVLPYDRPFRVPVTIGTITAEGQLDTGANVAFVLPKGLFDRTGGGAIEAAADGTLTNGTVKTGRATLAGPVRIGAATLSNVPVRVSATYPELLVGAHALQQFALLIDQRSKRVALCPPAPLRKRD